MVDEDIGIAGAAARQVRDLPVRLDGAVQVGPYSCARQGLLLRVVPGIGRFLAREGKALDYCVEDGADPAAVEALLKGGVLGALIHQRGELPLHATTLVAPDGSGALALAGHSGAGKSTTAYELVRRGWTLLSDDLTRVTVENGTALAWPGRTRLRLLRDACERFDLDCASLEPAPNWPDKYLLGLPGWDRPVPLAALVALDRSEGALQVRALSGALAARVLIEHTYRRHYVAALGRAQRHLELVATVAAGAKIFTTRGAASVEQVASSIAASVT